LDATLPAPARKALRGADRPSGRVGLSVFLLSLAVAGAAALWQQQRNAAQADERFTPLVEQIREDVGRTMQRYEYGLRGARGAWLAADAPTMSGQRFHTYALSRQPAVEFPGALGFGLIQRVPRDQEARFVAEARRHGTPDFAVRALIPHDGERYVIRHVEPRERNRQAIGLDIASEENRRSAAERALERGEATLTAPLTLVQATGQPQRSFLLLLPVYQGGALPATVPERHALGIGWSYAPLIIDDVLATLHQDPAQFALVLRDESQPVGDGFYATPGADEPAAHGLRRTVALPVYGRTWTLEVSAREGFVQGLDMPNPAVVGALGVLVAALLGLLGHLHAQGALRAAQVRAEQARRAGITERSSDAIITLDTDGHVIDWNRGAEQLFGRPAHDAHGLALTGLVVPPEQAAEHEALRAAVARGETAGPFDTVRLHAMGSRLDVSVAASPVRDGRGRIVGLAMTLRDIGNAKRAERLVREANASLEQQVRERTALLASALRDHEALLGTIRQHTIVSITDARGTIVDVNEAFCRISGYRADELIGQNHRLINSGVQPPIFWASLWRSITRGQAWRGEVCNRAKDGSLYWVDSIIAPLWGQDGRISRYLSIRIDISAAKQAEQQLRASQAFLDRAGRVAGVGGWELDLRTQELVWSDQTCRLHEIETGTVPALAMALDFYPGDARGRIEGAVKDGLAHGTSWDLELPFRTALGNARWVRAMGTVELEDGQPVRLVGAIQDITERKAAEARLAAVSSLLHTVLESASEVSVIATAPDLTIQVFNKGAELLLGYRSDELVGRHDPSLFHDEAEMAERSAQLAETLGHPVRGGEVFIHPSTLRQPRAWTYVAKDGRRIDVSLVVTAMHGDDGELLGYLGIAHDVTAQRRSEATLRAATAKAEQASLAKSQFLANMSHEIRTPMNAVIGLTWLLGQTRLDTEQTGFVHKIGLASKSLMALINDVLDLSKIEAGELNLEHARFDLPGLLHEVAELMSVPARAKALDFRLDLPAVLPDALVGDATRLQQILINLLSNAIKFTERGRVTLRLRVAAVDSARPLLQMTVEDTGIGIAADVQARLFRPFAQADSSTTRQHGGTGLGLSIVRQLVTEMGGQVTLSSQPGVGSRFEVELPFDAAPPDADLPPSCFLDFGLPRRPSGRLPGVRLLVADDSEVNLEVARRILEREGATVALADHGLQAIERVRAAPQAVDLVLMDVQMPVLDGLSATRELHALPGCEDLPVLALTAGALSSEQHRAEQAGMLGFVTKPFDPNELVLAVLRHLRQPPEPSSTRGAVGTVEDLAATPSAEVAAADWPALDGIDRVDVHARLGGDLALFRKLLRRLLASVEGFDGVALVADGLDVAAARLHHVRGTASLLGAYTVQALCADAEAACRAGHADLAGTLARRIGPALAQLRRGSDAFLSQPDPSTAGEGALAAMDRPVDATADAASTRSHGLAGPADTTLPSAALQGLLDALGSQRLDALDRFDDLAPVLKAALGAAPFQRLRDAIDQLQFAPAAAQLEAFIADEAATSA
jgi:PAS domain S-box-containing protein